MKVFQASGTIKLLMEILALYADTHNTAVLASLDAEKSLEADGTNQVSGANDKEPV